MITTSTTVRRLGRLVLGLWSACAMFAPGASAGWRRDPAPESGRVFTAYAEPGDTATIRAADVEPVYEAALRFYRPPRNQFRRLDPHLLPARAGETATGALDPRLAATLVQRLGDRFCLVDAPGRCTESIGGELRVSQIYGETPDRVKVIVGCRMVWIGSASTDNGAQAFLLTRDAKGWHVADRGGVATPR